MHNLVSSILAATMLVGCQHGYTGVRNAFLANLEQVREDALQQSDDSQERAQLHYQHPLYLKTRANVDSILSAPRQVRYWNDSLARRDSMVVAMFYRFRTSDLFYYRDTTRAVFAYWEAMPWFRSFSPKGQASEMLRYAITISATADFSFTSNISRLSYQAFEHAKQLALASGDTTGYHHADSSFKAVARRVLTMPDSVRAAFGPPPNRPARIPWVLATLAAAFIAGITASAGRK